jgi:hypothetical protein
MVTKAEEEKANNFFEASKNHVNKGRIRSFERKCDFVSKVKKTHKNIRQAGGITMDSITITIGSQTTEKSKFLVNSFILFFSGATTKSTNLVMVAFCITQYFKVFVFHRHKLKFYWF